MRRCVVLLISAAICFAADAGRDAAAVISNLAASLTAGNAQEFLSAFDRAMPGYEKLRANVTALVRAGETQSYIDIVKNEGDDRARTIEMAWELRVQREGDTAPSRREARVTCKLEKQGKKWRIVGMEPVEWLGP
jgi:hypothetical protein